MIRKANLNELNEILDIYAYARSFMAQNGNPTQWGNTTPKKELIIENINDGLLYVVEEDGCLQGVFYFNLANDPTYDVIKNGSWLNDKPYGVIHRIASAGKKGGILKTCIEFCLNKTNHIRIDTHVYVGDFTMFGPNVTVATAGHPILPELRKQAYQYNMPVHIGKNCWIGAGALIMPGVTIGDNTVIGAGSVVTKDIPSNVVAVGNPCRVMREINERDKEFYFKNIKISDKIKNSIK